MATDRLQGLNIGLAWKPPCYVASTAALTLSGTQTVDGISVGSCERVLVKDQTDAKTNGIYIADSATWTRAPDWDGSRDAIPGTAVYVDRGTEGGGKAYVANSSSTAVNIDIGSTGDDVSFELLTLALAGVSAYSQNTLLPLTSQDAWRSTDGLNVRGSTVELSSSDIADQAVTLAKWAPGTAGALVTYSSTGIAEEIVPGTSGTVLTSNGASTAPTYQAVTAALPRSYLAGGTLYNSTVDAAHDIDIDPFACRDSSNAVDITLSSSRTKQLDASYAFGDGAGGLTSSLSLSATTTYHAHAIIIDSSADIAFDSSPVAANLITDHGITAYRRIRSLVTSTTADVLAFEQDGDYTWWVDRVLDVSTTSPSTTGATPAMTVPTGIEVIWHGNAYLNDTASVAILITSVFETNATPTTTVNDIQVLPAATLQNSQFERRTDTSAQIRYRSNDPTVAAFRLWTRGWFDDRGKND